MSERDVTLGEMLAGGSATASGYTKEILEIYDLFSRGVYVYCVGRLYKPELAEDATSAVFLRLVQQFDRLRGKNKADLRKWLYDAAANIAANHLRTNKRRNEILAEVAREQERRRRQAPQGVGQPDREVLYRAILRLKPKYQSILTMRFFQDLPTGEIAEVLGMKPVTVRVMLTRAMVRLRRELERSFGD